MEKAIEIKNLVKRYKDVLAVDNVSFSVEKGKAYAFLGCNGAGKSTTINMIAGILEKDDGEILIFNEDVDKNKNGYKEKLGLVFQNSVLDKPLSVKENLYNKAMLYGMPKNEIEESIAKLARALDFESYINKSISKLSGGQARRIDLARALVHNPSILILDEPTTGLDPQTRKLVWEFINGLKNDRELTILLTTHYMEEAADMDDVIIVDKGKIIVEGTPVELKTKYAGDYVKLYGVTDEAVAIKKLKSEKIDLKKVGERLEFTTKDVSIVKTLIIKYPELFNDFEVIKGKMDDVFLAVTGKNLGE